ncbi:netrin-1 [Chanos chanos]|uniref:Netrin-1 n=1 Tax=Chanos chanos TaxID=29144 RepID=A0A6J2VSF6_CHACN|nr:netrin-1-like [Chanos chanos]
MVKLYSPPSLPFPFLLLFLFLLVLLPPSLSSPSLSHSPLRWTSPHDPCYHLDGRPRHCLSEFINAAYGVPVQIGDPQQGAERNVSTLTDLHNPHNVTCWKAFQGWEADWTFTIPLGRRFEVTYISLQFCQQGEPAEPFSISILKSMDHGRSWRPLQYYSSDCVGKFGLPAQTQAMNRHQETEPLCSDPRPLQKHRGGMVLAFSTLDGRPSSPDFDYSPVLQDWVTATDIRVVFHRSQGRINGVEARPEQMGQVFKWRAGSRSKIVSVLEKGKEKAFLRFDEKHAMAKTTESKGRKQGDKSEKSLRRNSGKNSVQEIVHNVTRKETDTQTRDRPSSRKGKGRSRKKQDHQWKPCQDGGCPWTVEGHRRSTKGRELRRRRNNGEGKGSRSRSKGYHLLPSSLSAPPPPPLALSDLQVGGRCKCNGHASRCRRDNQGQAVCQCEHHTAGADCDVCKPFYYDRPWQRATPTQPHPCVPCECNSHSNKCRFSMAVYQQSGRRSGGVCLKCRHHTAGRNCQFCENGYTRDHSKPMNHRKACQPCQCHPLGAVGRWCNQSTGQCLCREGVTGPRCNRCAPGYKQGHSPLRPCLRIQEVAQPTPAYQAQYSIGEECLSYCQPSQAKVRMNLETYCQTNYVVKVQVRGKERSGPWWQFSIWVQSVFRVGTSSVRRGLQALWVPEHDLSCGCPALQVGRTFLLIGAEESRRSWAPGERRLVADRATLALQWREHWSPKLRGFRGQDKRGKCPTAPSGNSTIRSLSHLQTQQEYTPPHLVQSETNGHTYPRPADTGTRTSPWQQAEHTRDSDGQSTHTQQTHGQHGQNGHETPNVQLEDQHHRSSLVQNTQNPLQSTQNSLQLQ